MDFSACQPPKCEFPSLCLSMSSSHLSNFPNPFQLFISHHRGQNEIGLHSSVPSVIRPVWKISPSFSAGHSCALRLNWRVGCSFLCTSALKLLDPLFCITVLGSWVFMYTLGHAVNAGWAEWKYLLSTLQFPQELESPNPGARSPCQLFT